MRIREYPQMLYRVCLIAVLIYFFPAKAVLAAITEPLSTNTENNPQSELGFGVEIGALSFLGTDLRLTYHQPDTPWSYGLRYLNIKDNFINEAQVGLPGDASDKIYTIRSGVFLNYNVGMVGTNTFYLSGALYQVTEKIICGGESASDSGSGIYFGAGFNKRWPGGFGYNLGLLITPMVQLSETTPNCSNDTGGDIDINASVTYTF